MTGPAATQQDEPLKRDIGLLGSAMLVLNGIVGASIFALPGTLLADFGAFSPFLFPVFGLLVLLIALPLGEAASYFDRTGGPVVYTREAFGPFISFQVGWCYYIARFTAFDVATVWLAASVCSLVVSLLWGDILLHVDTRPRVVLQTTILVGSLGAARPSGSATTVMMRP